MRCTLYSNDGPVMGEGTCEVVDGTISMTAREWHTTPQVDGRPLTLVMEDGTGYTVRVDGVHIVESDPEKGHLEVYSFTPLQNVSSEAMAGSEHDREARLLDH